MLLGDLTLNIIINLSNAEGKIKSFTTDWGLIAAENLIKTSGSGKGAYAERIKKIYENMIKMYTSGKNLTSPKVIAKTIVKATITKKPKTRYVTAYMLFTREWLSNRPFDSKLLNS